MKTVKAKIKGTNAILEGCVCDDSFFVSVDHDTFERYDLDEVELCESNPNSLTLEEAAEKYRRESYSKSILPNIDGPMSEYGGNVKAAFIAGAEWQKSKMLKDAVEGEVYLYHSYNRDATAIFVDIPKENLGDKVRLIVLKEEEE